MAVTHLTDATAYHPGTTRRSGNPCWTGSGSPFTAYASSAPVSRTSSSASARSKCIGVLAVSAIP